MAVQLLVLLLPFQALAYPSSQTCDFACLGGYTPGSSYGYMGIANIGATTGATCAIATDIPSGGYTSGTSYTITVSSTTALAQKLACDIGTLGGLTVANTNTKTTSQTYTWMAPSTCSGSVKFRALCGAGGYIDEMWVAEEVTEAGCTSSTSSTTPEEEVATTTTTTTTTGSTSSTSESSASTSSSSTSSTVASNDSQTSGVPSLINGAQCFQWSVLILLAQIACNLVI
mgnify:CR=1